MKAVILYNKFDWMLYNTILKWEGYTLECNAVANGLSGGWIREPYDLAEPTCSSLIWRAVKYEP